MGLAREQLELEHPEWFLNGANGAGMIFGGFFMTLSLLVFLFFTTVPVFLLGVLVMVIGAARAGMYARRIAQATGVKFWTAVKWMLTAQVVRRQKMYGWPV